MYIVRWLMGHPIIATWFLGAIAILLTIGNSNVKKESHVDDHTEKQEHVVSTDSAKTLETPSAVTSALIKSDEENAAVVETIETESDKHEEAAKSEVASVKKEQEDQHATQEKSEETVTKTTVDSTEVTSRSYPDGLTVGSDAIAVTANTVTETVDVPASTQVETSATNDAAATIEETPKPEVVAENAASIQDLGQTSTEEMLLMAREAYWNNGLDEASQIYTQLIQLEPKVIEHRGELGNVYWRQGFPKKAAQLYSEIAIPMIEQGNSERVANMIGFIGLFYPDRAAEIHKRLEAAKH